MQAGFLNKIIEIEKRIVTTNTFNEQVAEYEKCLVCRAQVVYNNGNRSIENDELVVNYSPTFIVRQYHDINETMRIKFDDKYYRIVSIMPSNKLQNKTIITDLINE